MEGRRKGRERGRNGGGKERKGEREEERKGGRKRGRKGGSEESNVTAHSQIANMMQISIFFSHVTTLCTHPFWYCSSLALLSLRNASKAPLTPDCWLIFPNSCCRAPTRSSSFRFSSPKDFRACSRAGISTCKRCSDSSCSWRTEKRRSLQ